MRQWAAGTLCALGMLLLLLGGMLLGLYGRGTDKKLYLRTECAIAPYEEVGLSIEETHEALSALADYLRGERLSLEDTAFNMKERQHMADVKGLFTLCMWASVGCLAVGLMLLAAASLAAKKRVFALLGWSWLASWVLLAAVGGVAWGIGFDRLFIRFHQLFFTNDLWLMDPATDVMIRMMPQQFFEIMLREIIRPLNWVGVQAGGVVVAGFVRKLVYDD